MHFDDLTPFTYSRAEESASFLNVGWLGEGHAFPVELPRPALVSVLRTLVANPVNLYRGKHQCEFCPAPPPENRNCLLWNTAPEEMLGNGEIHVPGEAGFVQACLAHAERLMPNTGADA
jgi:hypothetical protein